MPSAPRRGAARWDRVTDPSASAPIIFPRADHRINLTLHKLDRILDGEALDELVDALTTEDQAAQLAEDDSPDD